MDIEDKVILIDDLMYKIVDRPPVVGDIVIDVRDMTYATVELIHAGNTHVALAIPTGAEVGVSVEDIKVLEKIKGLPIGINRTYYNANGDLIPITRFSNVDNLYGDRTDTKYDANGVCQCADRSLDLVKEFTYSECKSILEPTEQQVEEAAKNLGKYLMMCSGETMVVDYWKRAIEWYKEFKQMK